MTTTCVFIGMRTGSVPPARAGGAETGREEGTGGSTPPRPATAMTFLKRKTGAAAPFVIQAHCVLVSSKFSFEVRRQGAAHP